MTRTRSLLGLVAAAILGMAPMAQAIKDRATTDRLVFCHFMVGIVSDRTSSADYDSDMQRAKDLGIDAFALNIGTDSFTDTQLGYAYQSAADNDMSVFISFDFNWWSTADAASVGAKIAEYATQSAQLTINGAVFVSSFAGDGLDVSALRSAAGVDVFWAPNFNPTETPDASNIDGALNWMAWDNNGNNKAPTVGANVTVEDGDATYIEWLGSKAYIAPVSPWFSTHYGPEVSYSKNWVFPGDLLWFRRWNDILTLGPQFLEIITWNDYGESHYIGPLESEHYDDGNSKWVNDMPHDGWADMARPFIAAYHDGASSPDSYVTSDKLVYWYRRTLRTIDCDATDTCMVKATNTSGNYFLGKPNGQESLEDAVFVVAMLTEAGTVTVTSGSNAAVSFTLEAGVSAVKVPLAVGSQQFSLVRDGTAVLSGTSLMEVSDVCPCGIYNFNAYVGSLPDGFSDPLGSDGLSSLTVGLHVTTCLATPSLGVATASATATTTATTTTTSPTATSCNAGMVASGLSGNYIGLCSFACNMGYCPAGVCVCTSYGTPTTPNFASESGCPIAGEDSSYDGLCSFCCANGYCPSTACTTDC